MYKLLVADDETRDRNIVRILVEKQYPGLFEILEAKSGTQALEVLRQEQIDLLVLDMNMPGLSGMSVIRELPSPVYVIILTAYSFSIMRGRHCITALRTTCSSLQFARNCMGLSTGFCGSIRSGRAMRPRGRKCCFES